MLTLGMGCKQRARATVPRFRDKAMNIERSMHWMHNLILHAWAGSVPKDVCMWQTVFLSACLHACCMLHALDLPLLLACSQHLCGVSEWADGSVCREPSKHCHAYGSQQQLCLNKVCDLSLTWIFWGVTRMRWCHLWELLGFELGVSVHLPASRGTLPVGIGVGICVCVCRCVVGSCSCVSTRGCMRCLGSRVCNCL